MSVYIKGMEMPNKKNGAVLIIYPDGKCAFEDGKTYQAVPVTDHGRLIDADAFCAKDNKDFEIAMDVVESKTTQLAISKLHDQMQAVISEAPTIISADRKDGAK